MRSLRPRAPRARRAAGLLVPLALALGPALAAPARPGDPSAVSTIERKEVEEQLRALAAPGMEGRDSPSEGLARAAEYICQRFQEAGLQPAADAGEVMRALGGDPIAPAPAEGETSAAPAQPFLRPYRLRLDAPDPQGCALALIEGEETVEFVFGRDFVPAPLCAGTASGELVFAGFGISSKGERYDDFRGLDLEGKVAIVFEGEPRHRKKFEGEEHTEEASLWKKLEALQDERVAGVLVVRRHPQGAEPDPDNGLDFRYTYASFLGSPEPRAPRSRPPVLEVSAACATRLLGTDAEDLAEGLDRTARPKRLALGGRSVRMSSATERREVRIDNVVGVLPGSDPALADQYVVLGAHYDHIGVDARGRVGAGADDNASGTTALLQVTAALAEAGPRRSVLVCCFASEEDGLVGSKELCKRLPVERSKIVAMVNLDMVGRGDTDEVVVLGTRQNPDLEQVLDRAKRLSRTGVKRVVATKDDELWRRSDHFSFHELGIPTLFFFEGLPISKNRDYHTWRDVPDEIDFEKVTRTARLVFNTVWILAEDDEPPPPPR